ncbi:MAG: phosphoribosylformylglycinamidine synthase subunit PurL [Anaerolineales bacterium]|nr:phosphoribosylformylglycinamidine synthase subunit PurL [Anaerolineales bacterium]
MAQLPALGLDAGIHLKITDLFFVEGDLDPDALHELTINLLCDPVTQTYEWHPIDADRVTTFEPNASLLDVIYRPGVTDTVANELLDAGRRLGLKGLEAAATGTRYTFQPRLSEEKLHHIARNLLVNDTIQRYSLNAIQPEFSASTRDCLQVEQIELRFLSESDLLLLSQARRLALNAEEMRAVQSYFMEQQRPARDAELETIAQTWSEHCIHKTFRALIHIRSGNQQQTIDNLLKTCFRAATEQINAPWVRSAFVDNAGVIEFDQDFDLSFKVETHNHPSAIEPFGGANTGVGGVVRDILGVSHRPVANTNALFFGPPDLPLTDLPAGVLHPSRIRAGVVAGIEDYGNKLGLPTVNGLVFYHPGYTANPLVYCGCVGIGPRACHPRQASPEDRIIVLGGRTGRDGLRGATFSSLTMNAQTGQVAGASVQIGDPITEKGLLEVVTRARDAHLYTAITDCGAGGLSSAVGEMAAELGARVDLATVPLKYAGLAPWEIWLSEAQERMVMAVPVENLEALADICATYWVEWSDIGVLEDSGRLRVFHGDLPVVDLENSFLHTCPKRELAAQIPVQLPPTQAPIAALSTRSTPADLLLGLLAHRNIASKEAIIRVYDHEVRGGTVVKPLVGPHHDGPSDAAVIKPRETSGWRGFVLANGCNPLIGEQDAYAMAVSAVDEAVRNAVVVGADPERIAILDNFCWGDPLRPETLGDLVQAARGCYDAALHYHTPFISGKDSLNNEYTGPDGYRHAIPGTLLISSIAIHPDVRQAVTMDLKAPGNPVYLLGQWSPALAGSHAVATGGLACFAQAKCLSQAPQLPLQAPAVYRAFHQAVMSGLVQSAHDLSEGGLGVAAAEMALAGRIGLRLDTAVLHEDPAVALFAETNGCLLVEVLTGCADKFQGLFEGLPLQRLGTTISTETFVVDHNHHTILEVPVDVLVKAFQTS